jgi:type IV secretion system protein VirB6
MNKIYFILIIKILFIFPISAFAKCPADLPPHTSDSLLYPYINSMFSMDNCSDDDEFIFKMKTNSKSNDWKTTNIKLGNSINVDLSLDPDDNNGYGLNFNIVLFPEIYNNNLMCLSYPTVNGSTPIICKKYSGSSTKHNDTPLQSDNPCFNDTKHSKYKFNFSGRAIDCLRGSLDQVFFKKSLSSGSVITNFVDFQASLQKSIFAALLLYVIFFGIKISLEKDQLNLNSVAKFVLTFICVLYFSVGLNVFSWDGSSSLQNGFVTQILPFLKNMSFSLANFIFNSSKNNPGLCDFSSMAYTEGKEFYQLWDSIDCRLFTYFGINNQNKNLFMVMFGMAITGNILFLISCIVFIISFMSLILFFISTSCVYLITIYAMGYIAPIFIPLALFEKTKGYFNSWFKICFSCALQPAILCGFIALMLTFYDQVVYSDCKFTPNIDGSVIDYFSFDISLESCANSFGSKMKKYYTSDDGWEDINLLLFKVRYLRDIYNVTSDMIYIMFFCIIGYFFSQSLTKFSSTITGGPNVGNVSFSPTAITDKIISGLKSGMKSIGESGSDGGGAKSEDTASGGGGGGKSEDTASRVLGGGKSQDTASSAGGGGNPMDKLSSTSIPVK